MNGRDGGGDGAIVVDTSAAVAILADEAGRGWLSARLAAATDRMIAAPTALELGIVLEARAPIATDVSRRALRDAQVVIVPFDEDLAERGLHAWRRFGKGRHRAGLDFGDCCTDALAERTGCLILCTGDDFRRTDLPVLVPPTR